MVLLCGFIRAYFARVRGVVCLVVFRAFVRLWRRSVPVVALCVPRDCLQVWQVWQVVEMVRRRFRFRSWCGGAVVFFTFPPFVTCARSCVCARVVYTCARVHPPPMRARETGAGCYPPFPRSKKFYRGKNVGVGV